MSNIRLRDRSYNKFFLALLLAGVLFLILLLAVGGIPIRVSSEDAFAATTNAYYKAEMPYGQTDYGEAVPESSVYSNANYGVKHANPTFTFSAAAYVNDALAEENDHPVIYLNLASSAWKQKEIYSDENRSIYQQIALTGVISEYSSYTYQEYYGTSGNWFTHQQFNNPTESETPNMEQRLDPMLLTDSHITVSGIYVSGHTWYGAPVSEFNILENDGQNLIAGEYELTKVSISYTYTTAPYIDCVIRRYEGCYINGQDLYTKHMEGSGKDATYYPDMTTKHTVVTTVSESKTFTFSGVKVICGTNVTVGVRLSDRLRNNLGMNATYNPDVRVEDRIFLYDPDVSINEEGEEKFYFALNDGSRDIFRAAAGFYPNVVGGTDFGLDDTFSGSKPIAEYLQIDFFTNAECDLALDPGDETATYAGKYYFKLQPNTAYTGEDTKKTINFIFANSEYVQEVTVARKILHVSLKDSKGIEYATLNENGVVTTPYDKQYTEASFYASQIGKTIENSGDYYTYVVNEHGVGTYSPLTNNTRLALGTTYYLRQCSGKEMIRNRSMTEEEWNFIGGFSHDIGNVDSSLFAWEGSTLPGYAIQAYDRMNFSLYVNNAELSKNYAVRLGEYSGNDFTEYPLVVVGPQETPPSTSYMVSTGENFSGSTMCKYIVYGNFAVTSPTVSVVLGSFGARYYGEISIASDMEFSAVRLEGGNVVELSPGSGVYTVITSAENWRAKIIRKESDKTEDIDSRYNYIFVEIVLGKRKNGTVKADLEYQAENGDIFVRSSFNPNQVFYAGEYYVYCLLSYRLAGAMTNDNPINGMSMGRREVSIDVEKDGQTVTEGIVEFTLFVPQRFEVKPVELYAYMNAYSLDKVYDGDIFVKTAYKSGEKAGYTIRQVIPEGYVLSPAIKNIMKTKYKKDITTILEYDTKIYVTVESFIYYSSSDVGLLNAQNEREPWEISCYTEFMAQERTKYDDEFVPLCASYYANIDEETKIGRVEHELALTEWDDIPDGEEFDKTIKGTIFPLELKLSILEDPDRITDIDDESYSVMAYHRSYRATAYAAIRVAKSTDENAEGVDLKTLYSIEFGRQPEKDYYADYYYYFDEDESVYGYCFYRQLPYLFVNGKRSDVCYFFFEIDQSGFLKTDNRTEGFPWDETETTGRIMGFNVSSINEKTDIKPYSTFIDWSRTQKMNEAYEYEALDPALAEYSRLTDWSAGFYHIPIVSEYPITNYVISLAETSPVSDYIPLEIVKIQLEASDVIQTQDRNVAIGRTLVYDKTPKIEVVFTSDLEKSFIIINNHNEKDQIYNNPLYKVEGGDLSVFKNLLKVKGYTYNLEEEADNPIVVPEDYFDVPIKTMLYAGQYVLEVTIPETENYKKVVGEVTLYVECASVTVYTTAAIRTYMSDYDPEKEIRLAPKDDEVDEHPELYLTAQELADYYTAYMDKNDPFELHPDDDDRIKTYVYYKDGNVAGGIYDTSYVHLYYVGFVVDPEGNMDIFTDDDVRAKFTVDTTHFYDDVLGKDVDVSKRHDGVISVFGAKKRNYKFVYEVGSLYVRKQQLILNIDGNQKKTFSGEFLSPKAEILTEEGITDAPAELKQFIAAYFLKEGEKYRIYMRDFSVLNELRLNPATMSLGPEEEQKRDYYYYFETYTDRVSSLPVDVVIDGDRRYFVSGETEIDVYAIGKRFYYYPNNDKGQNRIELVRTETRIYLKSGTTEMYYLDDDLTQKPIVFEPNFDLMEDGKRVLHIAVVDNKKIYIGINENEKASTQDSKVKNVFAYNNGFGGYILKLYADPDEIHSDNYNRTETQIILFTVNRLELNLRDIPCADHKDVLNDGTVEVEYCDCNVFETVLHDKGSTDGLLREDPWTIKDSVIANFNSLSALYATIFGSNYLISDTLQTWYPAETDAEYLAYSQFYEQAKTLFASSDLYLTHDLLYALSSGVIVGINKPFILAAEEKDPEYEDYIAMIAKLFGYTDPEMFSAYAARIADMYLRNAAGASSSDRRVYDGTIYTDNGSFILPFAFGDNRFNVALAFVVVDANGNMSIWVNDVDVAGVIVDDDAGQRSMRIYGCCSLFEQAKINPLWVDEYTEKDYKFKDLSQYYYGLDENNHETTILTDWASVGIETIEGVQQFFFDAGSEEKDLLQYGRDVFAKYIHGEETNLRPAQNASAIVCDAGVYVILVKVALSTRYLGGEYPVDMSKNVYFGNRSTQDKYYDVIQTPENDNEAYFVLYLVMDRSSSVALTIKTSDHVNAQTNSDGEVIGYTKEYDATEISFSEEMNVLSKESSKGERLSVRAYLSKQEDYTESSYLYFITGKNKSGENIFENVWNSEDKIWAENGYIDLTHVNEFYMTVIINYDDRRDAAETGDEAYYNNNFKTIVKQYKISITKRNLIISIWVIDADEEGNPIRVLPTEENSGKNYGQKNSEVEGMFTYTYSNWAGDDEGRLTGDIVTPEIDWVTSGLSVEGDDEGQKIPADSYRIVSMGGKTPGFTLTVQNTEYVFSDYKFDYTSSRVFVVRPLKLAMGGTGLPRISVNESMTYAGAVIKPVIYIIGWDGTIVYYKNDNEDPIDTDQIYIDHSGNIINKPTDTNGLTKLEMSVGRENFADSASITLLGRINNYDANRTYTLADAGDETIVSPMNGAVNCGFYLFRINVGTSASGNYEGLDEPVAWVFEIKKAPLKIIFVDENGNEARGSQQMVYTGTPGGYPAFSIRYTGFRGGDITDENESIQYVQFVKHTLPDKADIPALNLYNPFYIFVNKDGAKLCDADGVTPFMPVRAGEYFIRLDTGDGFGYASNYYIEVGDNIYKQEEGAVQYPILKIQKRAVGVVFTEGVDTRITKEFDANDSIKEGSVLVTRENVVGNYSFNGMTSDNTGLIPGDYISLKITYASSFYERSTVYDEFGEQSDINVYILADANLIGTDAENYEFSLALSERYGSTKVIDGVTYVKLVGRITQARAVVRFYNESGQTVTTNRVTYTGEQQHAIVKVLGVNNAELTLEAGDYSLLYSSERSGWNSEIAPTTCDLYEVTVTIRNKNYYETPSTSYLEIEQADVEIVFGGEGVQTYGSISNGLTAVANGVHEYRLLLAVNYYYMLPDGKKGDLVYDISLAPTGTYLAEATHAATDNYKEKSESELFIIARKETDINSDIPSNMVYTGSAFNLKVYFTDNGRTYNPTLLFDKRENNMWVPKNYVVNGTEVTPTTNYPSDAGEYRVRAYEICGDYTIVDTAWRSFIVTKADLTLQVIDSVITEGTSVNMQSEMTNCLTSDRIEDVVQGLSYRFFKAVSGEEVPTPTEPGTYKVIGYGATAVNYNISYKFGILTINKKHIAVAPATQSGANSIPQILFEGSFSVDISITVSQAQSVEEAMMTDAFNNFKSLNEDFAGYTLKKIFVFNYSQYTTDSQVGKAKIKLYLPELFTAAQNTQTNENNTARSLLLAANSGEYYVMIMTGDGNVQIVKGYQDGDYLCIDTEEGMVIKAISVLEEAKEKNNSLDWLLYVGIAIGALLIAASIIIVTKKA